MLYQPPPREAYRPPHISIDGTNLNAMERFTYRGSVISSDAIVRKDLDNRLSKASSSFGRLSKRVWQSHSLRLSTKTQVHRPVVGPTPLSGAETRVLFRKQIRPLERFHQRCLRSILGIKWQNYVLLGWPRHKDGRRTRAQSSLLQLAPRRKARSWCSK